MRQKHCSAVVAFCELAIVSKASTCMNCGFRISTIWRIYYTEKTWRCRKRDELLQTVIPGGMKSQRTWSSRKIYHYRITASGFRSPKSPFEAWQLLKAGCSFTAVDYYSILSAVFRAPCAHKTAESSVNSLAQPIRQRLQNLVSCICSWALERGSCALSFMGHESPISMENEQTLHSNSTCIPSCSSPPKLLKKKKISAQLRSVPAPGITDSTSCVLYDCDHKQNHGGPGLWCGFPFILSYSGLGSSLRQKPAKVDKSYETIPSLGEYSIFSDFSIWW